MEIQEVKELAKDLRREIIESSYATGKIGVHIGPALSAADYLAYLYGKQMNVSPERVTDENRDRFVLSKGHAYTALYSILSLRDFFSQTEFRANFMTDGGLYPAHPIKQLEKGIECSSGSLGMGISFAVGKAIIAKQTGQKYHIYCLLGDAECEEGPVWEAFIAAAHYKLDNLTVIIDRNRMSVDGNTEELMAQRDMQKKMDAFGFEAVTVDGHDIHQLMEALKHKPEGMPCAIIAETTKGKGVSFIENNKSWHQAILSEKLYHQAVEELSK